MNGADDWYPFEPIDDGECPGHPDIGADDWADAEDIIRRIREADQRIHEEEQDYDAD